MNFATPGFLWFFVAVVALHWVVRGQRARKLLLLIASYWFYAAWDWRFLGLIALSTAIDFAAGHVIAGARQARTRRIALVVSVVSNLGILAVFKYAGFFLDSFVALAQSLGFQPSPLDLAIVLPVGISFFTFQSMSYTIDLYRGRIALCRDPFDFALFVAFFPQLVAGPIVRAASFLPQLDAPRSLSAARLGEGLERMALGLAKKVVVADTLAAVADPVFASPGAYGFWATWLGVLAFTFQIYADFSGYSDIAIGAARVLGYDLPENFRHPYLAASPREFWQRWHVSLSTWLRDYLYIPLGGNRSGRLATARNLWLTMLLGGLWHGAAWTFVAWGAWHGSWLVGARAVADFRAGPPRLPRGLGMLATFGGVVVSWVLFRAASFPDALEVVAGLLGTRGADTGAPLRWSAAWILLIPIATHLLAALDERRSTGAMSRHPTLRAALLTGAVLGTLAFWRADPGAFIYFQF